MAFLNAFVDIMQLPRAFYFTQVLNDVLVPESLEEITDL